MVNKAKTKKFDKVTYTYNFTGGAFDFEYVTSTSQSKTITTCTITSHDGKKSRKSEPIMIEKSLTKVRTQVEEILACEPFSQKIVDKKFSDCFDDLKVLLNGLNADVIVKEIQDKQNLLKQMKASQGAYADFLSEK